MRLSPGLSFLRGAAIAIALALSPILITFSAGTIARAIRCDLNEVAEHPCIVLGMNVGTTLAAMAQSIWFIAPTATAGLLALIVLFIVWVVRVVRARRAQVDGVATEV
jgi:hypothetical protein